MRGQMQVVQEAAAREAAAQESRREHTQVSHAKQVQARLDQDAQIAFNADLLAFASRFDVEAPTPRSRTSPLRSLSPLRPRVDLFS